MRVEKRPYRCRLSLNNPNDSAEAGAMNKNGATAEGFDSSAYQNVTLWSRPGFLARRLHQIHVAIFLDLLAEQNLTSIQWGIMTVVAGQPGLGFGEIAQALGIERSNAADVCMRLAEKGIIALSASREDKRKKCAFLTKKGTNVMKRYGDLVNESQQRLLDPLNTAERKIFLGLLRRIVDHNNEFSRAPIRCQEDEIS